MAKIITSPKILADATNSGFKYLEKNEYRKAQKMLKYVAEQTNPVDQYVLYALGIIHYNLGEIEELADIFMELKKLKNVNGQIYDAVTQMNQEVNKRKTTGIEDVEGMIIHIKDIFEISDEEYLKIYEQTKNMVYKEIATTEVNQENYKQLAQEIKPYYEACMLFDDFVDLYYGNKDDKQISEKLHFIYNNTVRSTGQSIFILLGLRTKIFQELLKDPEISMNLKNELLCDIESYHQRKYPVPNKIEYLNEPKELKIYLLKNLATEEITYPIDEQVKEIYMQIESSPLKAQRGLVRYVTALAVKYLKIHYLEIAEIDLGRLFLRLCNYILVTGTVENPQTLEYLKTLLVDFDSQEEDREINQLIQVYEEILSK